MRSFLAGLRRLVIPWGAADDQPRIVIATDDPLTDGINDATVNFYWDKGRGYSMGVERSGTGPTARGQLRISAVAPADEVAGDFPGFSNFLALEFDPANAAGDMITLIGGTRIDETNSLSVAGPAIRLGTVFTSDQITTDVYIYGRSLPRGLIARSAVNNGTVASLTTTESIVRTLPTATFIPGRAYEVSVRGLVQISATADIRPRVLKTNLSGQLLGDYGPMPVNGNNVNRPLNWSCCFLVGGSTAINASLVLGMATTSGTTAVVSGFSTNAFEMKVNDIGASNDYPGFPVLT